MRTVGVKLTADVTAYIAGMKRAGASTKDFVGEMDKAARAGNLDAVADRAGMAGLAIAGMAGYAVKSAAQFEKAMSGVKAATHASAGEIDALRKAALQAGQDTQYSATEAAQAITELSKAGVATADVLGGGLAGALDLAAAGQMDVAEAAETAASAMTMFKLKGKDVPHIADLLAAGAGKAQGSVHDMGMALNQAGLVASQMGLSIEDTTGTLASFASAGLLGSDAGTSLKTAMLMLANPTDKAKDLMAELGINAYDASGQFVGIAKLAGQLKTQLGGLTQEQRNSALATIFGADAIRAASILYEQGEQGIQGWIAKVNDAGYAAETAKTQTDNLIGDLERLKGSLETLAIESGGGANSGLRVLAQGAEAVVDQFALLPSGISGAITVMGLLSGALLLGASGWVKMRRSNAEALEELRNTGPAGQRAATGLQATTRWAGRAAVAFGVAQIAAAGVTAAFGSDLNPKTEAFAQSLEQWAKGGKKAGEATRLLGDDFEHLSYDLGTLDSGFWAGLGNGVAGTVESLTGLGSVMDESLQHAKERLQGIDAALTQMVQSGNAASAGLVFTKLAEEAKKSGVSVDELKKGLPGYAAALQTAGTAASGVADATGKIPGPTDAAAGATKEYASAADAAAAAATGQRDALVALSNAMKAETDPVFALLDAQNKLAKAQTDAAKATKEHGAKSAEAKEANRELAIAAIDLQEKVGALGDTFNGKLSPSLVATLRNAGLTEAQIHDIETQFRDAKKAGDAYAKKYEATVTAKGAKESRREVQLLKAEIAQLKNKSITIRVTQKGEILYGNQAPQMATGGPITGPGPKGRDSELRMLAPGEHVLTSREVDAMGGHGAVMRMRSAAISGPRMAGVGTSMVMPQTGGGGTTTIVHEHRLVLEGRGSLGQLLVNEVRNQAGTKAQLKQLLGLPVS
jgi:TP901 family phage tail tape measure protein